MNEPIEWKFWSAEQIVKALPRLLTMVDTSAEDFSQEHWEKNRIVIESLRTNLPSGSAIRDGSRTAELITLGFALDFLASKIVKRSGNLDECLRLFQAAHELFRGGNSSLHPTKPMRLALNDALKSIMHYEIVRIQTGEIVAESVLETINTFVISAWGYIPPQLVLNINEMMLTNLEETRRTGENDTIFHERFIRENIETVLAMEVPTKLEKIQEHWQDVGEHIAPVATRTAVRILKRPQILSTFLTSSIREQMRQALEKGNVSALGSVLEQVEDDFKANLRLRLTARPEYRDPSTEIRFRGQPDRFFGEARDLLLRQNPGALRKFQNIHFHKPNDPLAKEWYAYALSRFGIATDIHEIIQLLEDAINIPSYRLDTAWTARWNLACALRRLPPRAHEALNELLPILENDDHNTEVFELCLLWALDQERKDVLAALLLRSPFYEAHLLAALYSIRTHSSEEVDTDLRDHFRRINRILRDTDHVFPDPKERLEFDELDRLTRDFIETSLVAAGIEWFRQRVSYTNERRNWKNWECAAKLNERAGDLHAAWRCLCSQWHLTSLAKALSPQRKTPVLRALLFWAERNSFEDGALRILRQDWQKTSMTENDVRMFELRLQKTPMHDETTTAGSARTVENEYIERHSQAEMPPSGGQRSPHPGDAEHVIQQVADSFMAVTTAKALAEKISDAQQLIDAVIAKYPENAPATVAPIRETLQLVQTLHTEINDQQAHHLIREMREQLPLLQRSRESLQLPFEIARLEQACERVIQNISIRTTTPGDSEIIISPLESLKLQLDIPRSGEIYRTRIFARLTNPGSEEIRNIRVVFTSSSPCLYFPDVTAPLAHLEPEGETIVEGIVEVSDGVNTSVEISIDVTYKSGEATPSVHYTGHVPVSSIGLPIPLKQRYMTGTPVTAERTDLFHGRDRELKDLLGSFAGGRLLRLYFVNGIRRVGKSTLMNQLCSRCGNTTLPLLLNLQDALGDSNMTTIQLVRQLIRNVIEQVRLKPELSEFALTVPGSQAFELDPPWVVFEDFLENLRIQAGRESILICFDEVQYLVERIADPKDPINEAFLSWLRSKVQGHSNILFICTGSEPYAVMRRRYEHSLWGNMEAYNVSFVEKAAMKKIAALPVKQDGVTWLPEAIEHLWDATEGHPWLIQALSERMADCLNIERRRLVGPADVDRAVDRAMRDERYSSLWWNEEEGQVTPIHRQIAFLILQHQAKSRLGLPESELYEHCQKDGIRTVGRYLDEMCTLEVLTISTADNDPHWRIKGGFLEKYLMTLIDHTVQEDDPKPVSSSNQPLALMLDWENIKISLLNLLPQMPVSDAQVLRQRLNGASLATRLLEAATRHGLPRQKWAVANWDRPTFAGDQAALRRARYMPDMAGEEKADASDHVLIEKIHYVLREQPEINTYIIGTGDADFGEVIKTLQEKGKHVVLWTTKRSVNDVYKHYLTGPNRIQIEWLENLLFEKEG